MKTLDFDCVSYDYKYVAPEPYGGPRSRSFGIVPYKLIPMPKSFKRVKAGKAAVRVVVWQSAVERLGQSETMLLAIAAANYVVSRLNDKTYVGPKTIHVDVDAKSLIGKLILMHKGEKP